MENTQQTQRRALNIVWTAAEDYTFQPDFLAFDAAKKPDLYLNIIIGLVHKHYDAAALSAFFSKLQTSAMKDTFTDILWLGLENAVFQKELPDRPILQNLRTQHAKAFFIRHTDLSLQQLMMRSELRHNLQAARWHTVLGEASGLLNPWEKRLFTALAFPACWDTRKLLKEMQQIQQRFFLLDFQNRPQKIYHFSLPEKLAAFLKKFLPADIRQAENTLNITRNVPVKEPNAPSAIEPAVSSIRSLLGLQQQKEDAAYIEEQFGPSLYRTIEQQQLEKAFCTGHHQNCHLHFTRGTQTAKTGAAALIDTARQQNMAYYESHRRLYALAIHKLSARLKNCLMVCQQPLPLRSGKGQMHAASLWRALRLQDTRIFTSTEEEPFPEFTVDLLLDASASRAGCQSLIAAQAYTIAESLRLCHIPLQITAYCSLRSYTVLQIFQRYGEPGKSKNVFNYTAAGWNRDGLAFRAMQKLIPCTRSTRRILIILSDARPNDAQRIPSETFPLSYDYSEQHAIDDTAAELQQLRKQGIQIIGLLNGELPNFLPAAQKIFGANFARIKKIDQLAAIVGELIQKQIPQNG